MADPYAGLGTVVSGSDPYAGLGRVVRPAANAPKKGRGSEADPYRVGTRYKVGSPEYQREVAKIPLGSYFSDPQGNLRQRMNPGAGQPIRKRNVERVSKGEREATGALANLNRGLLIGDEGSAVLGTIGNVLSGKVGPTTNNPLSIVNGLGNSFGNELAKQRSYEDDFDKRRPWVAAGAQTTGMVPTLFVPGGAPSQMATRGEVVANTAGNAALQAGAAGLLDRGSYQERAGQGSVNALGGAALGTVVGTALTRAPKGARVRNPGIDKAQKVARQDPAAMRAKQAEYRAAGIDPALVDVVDDSGRAVVRATASKMTPARQATTEFAEGRAVNLPDRIGGQARRYISATPQVADDVAATERAALEAQFRSGVGNAERGSGGQQISGSLNAARDAAKGRVDAAYQVARDAAPDQAMIPRAERPFVAQGLREAVADFDPMSVPRVTRELQRIDGGETLTVRDLFEARSRIGQLRASNDPVEGAAAGKAVRALDDQISRLVDEGKVSGDPNVVGLWRNAIAQRREFGQAFEGDDLVAKLTKGGRRSGEASLRVAPEDASNAMFGAGDTSMIGKPNLSRDMDRIRGMVDEGSFAAAKSEMVSRLGGGDGAALATNWRSLLQRDPQLARTLFSPDEIASIEAQIALAERPRPSQVGRQFLGSEDAQVFGRNINGMTPNELSTTRSVAAREIELAVGGSPAKAPGFARTLALGAEPSARTNALIGPAQGNAFRNALRLEERSVRNAADIAPRGGSQTALRSADNEAVDGVLDVGKKVITGGWRSAIVETGMNYWRSKGFKPKEAEEFTMLAIDPNRLDAALVYIEQKYGPKVAQQFQAFTADAAIRASRATGAGVAAANQNQPATAATATQ